jgi:hypothetical protein
VELQSEKKRNMLLNQQMVPWFIDTLGSFPLDMMTYNMLKYLMFGIPIKNDLNTLRNIEIDISYKIKNPGLSIHTYIHTYIHTHTHTHTHTLNTLNTRLSFPFIQNLSFLSYIMMSVFTML